MAQVREIERKYEPTPQAAAAGTVTLPSCAGVPGVAGTVDEPPVELDATYYDTPDLRLAADRITLRRRTGGSDAGWHLKLPADPADPGVRDEIQAPLSPGPPRELAGLVRSRVRAQPLVPLVRLRQRRTVRRLLDADGSSLVELSLDEVRAERCGTEGAATAWTEVEAELAEDADPAVLDALEPVLTADGSGLRRSAAPSKLRRALEETGAAPGAGDGGQDGGSVGAVVLRHVRTQVRALIELDPAVRRDVHDSVHRMRVATRRLRSAFRSFGRVLEPEATGPVGDELAWLARELGADRDQEVLAARLTDRLAGLPDQLRHGPVDERLRTFCAGGRTGSRGRLLAVLDSDRYLELLETLTGLLDAPPLRPAAHAAPGEVLARAVRRDHERLARRVDEALAAPAGDGRDRALHEARKAVKRARYAAEAARPALGAPAKQYAAVTTRVQELLGDHQDSVLVRRALLRIAAQAHAAGEPSFPYGVLYEREAALAQAREAELPGLWARVVRAAGPFRRTAPEE